MSTVRIRTTQNVIVEHNLATLGDRLLAIIIDKIVVYVYIFGIIGIMSRYLESENITAIIVTILFILPAFFYSLALEILLNGQTLGKKALQIRVIRMDGTPATIGNYIVRWLLRLIDDGMIGFLCIAITEKNQRLGDLAAGTVVIKTARKTNLADTLPTFSENTYEPEFAQARELTDSQAALIKEALNAYYQEDNYVVVDALSRKLRELLQIQTDMPPLAFLKTLLKDYSHLHNAA